MFCEQLHCSACCMNNVSFSLSETRVFSCSSCHCPAPGQSHVCTYTGTAPADEVAAAGGKRELNRETVHQHFAIDFTGSAMENTCYFQIHLSDKTSKKSKWNYSQSSVIRRSCHACSMSSTDLCSQLLCQGSALVPGQPGCIRDAESVPVSPAGTSAWPLAPHAAAKTWGLPQPACATAPRLQRSCCALWHWRPSDSREAASYCWCPLDVFWQIFPNLWMLTGS